MLEKYIKDKTSILLHYMELGYSIRNAAKMANMSKSAAGRIYQRFQNNEPLNKKFKCERSKIINEEI